MEINKILLSKRKSKRLDSPELQLGISQILINSSILREMMNKVEYLAKINKAILEKIDPTLSKHCRVTNVKDGCLTLETTTSTWGHQLRFSKADILSTLRKEPDWKHLSSIQIQVRPSLHTDIINENETFPRKPHLSIIGANYIESAALSVENPNLKKALLKLAGNSKIH